MSILIGGSPSTGSSLLRRMLNRHPDIFCGSETSLLSKAELYDDWTKNKTKLLKKSFFGLSDAGWQNFTGVALAEDYPWTKKELKPILTKSDSLVKFITTFFAKCLSENEKSLWAEKTPSNAFTFDPFLQTFGSEAKVVLTVRHPLDAISSMHNRGMTLYDSICVYLLNVAKASLLHDNTNLKIVKYEDLVSNPEMTLKSLCEFLGVAFASSMLESNKLESGSASMKGWKSKETNPPNTKSIGRYNELPELSKRRLMSGIELIRNSLNPQLTQVRDIATLYKYELPPAQPILDEDYTIFKSDMMVDKRNRRFSTAYFRSKNYPISLDRL